MGARVLPLLRRPHVDQNSGVSGVTGSTTWESRGNVGHGDSPGLVPDPVRSQPGPRNQLALRTRVCCPPRTLPTASCGYLLLAQPRTPPAANAPRRVVRHQTVVSPGLRDSGPARAGLLTRFGSLSVS